MDRQDFSLSCYASPRRDFALDLFIPDPAPLVISLQSKQCRAGPGHAGPGRAVLPLYSHCVLCSPQNPVRPLTRSLYQLICSLCCPSAGLVSPVSLYLCFACRSRPPLFLPFPSSSPPSTPSPCTNASLFRLSSQKKSRKNKTTIQRRMVFP